MFKILHNERDVNNYKVSKYVNGDPNCEPFPRVIYSFM